MVQLLRFLLLLKCIKRFVLSLLLLGAIQPVFAHHSHAMFDRTKTQTLSGTVTKFEFTNPHAWIWVDITDDEGNVTNWGFEMGSAPSLSRSGWKPKMLQPGDEITVTFNPLKNGSPGGAFNSAVFENGEPVGPKR